MRFAEAGDEIAKMAREVGLGAEALQELRFAADRQGVSAEDLDKALGALNNRVGQLRQNQGSLFTMLNRSNPALAEQLQNAEDTEDAFMVMMQALNDTADAQDRAALAQAAFGRSGQSLVRIAEAGAGGIEALRQEARDLGLVLSEEATAQSEKFQDAMTNLKAAMNGVRNNALAPLVSQLTPLIQRMADWTAANQELIQQGLESAVDRIIEVSRTLYEMWDNGVIPAILAAVVAFKAITGALALYNTTIVAARAATMLFSASVMSVPVFGWIIAAISAVIAIIVLLIKNWDRVSEVAQNVGAAIAGAMSAAADRVRSVWQGVIDWIMGALEFVQRIIDATIGKVIDVFNGGRDVGEQGAGLAMSGGTMGLVTPNTAGINSRTETVSRSQLDVNFGNMPRGTSVQQRGSAPGVSVNFGAAGAAL
jgi:hypothetical protein